MKRNTIYLLSGVILLGAIAFWLIRNSDNGTIRKVLKDFAVEDTGSVTKIFLADRSNHQVLLERNSPSVWILNGKEKAKPVLIQQLLSTIRNLSVRTRVSKLEYNGVMKQLATSSIKCEIYTSGSKKPFKVYYVGGSTQDILGTYMMLEKSSMPFVMELPGFNGYLTPRFSVHADDWKEKMVFAIPAAAIQSISIEYPGSPERSFRIEKTMHTYHVTNPAMGKMVVADSIRILNYLSFFSHLGFEDYDKSLTPYQSDSLKATIPLAIIRVKEINGNSTETSLYPKPVTRLSLAQTDDKGKPLTYDKDRLFAVIHPGKELVSIQYYVFGKVLKEFDDFDSGSAKH